MPPEKPSTLEDKLNTVERARNNFAWHKNPEGGVRGLYISAEKVKELAEKKGKKNYWKVGALVGGGIAALVSIIGYSFLKTSLQTQSTIQEEVLSREEALERFAPKMEYYGVIEEQKPRTTSIKYCSFGNDFAVDIFEMEREERKKKLNHTLRNFCMGNNEFSELLSCKIEECKRTDSNNNCVEYTEKERLGIGIDYIFDVKGVVTNNQYPSIELTAFDDLTIENVDKSLTHSKDYIHYILPMLLEELLGSPHLEVESSNFPLKGKLRLVITTDKTEYDTSAEEAITELIEEDKVKLILGYEDIDNIIVNEDAEYLSEDMRYTIKRILEEMNLNFKYSYEQKREFTLFSFSVDKREIILTPDQSKSPEENIAAMYELVDSFKTFMDRW